MHSHFMRLNWLPPFLWRYPEVETPPGMVRRFWAPMARIGTGQHASADDMVLQAKERMSGDYSSVIELSSIVKWEEELNLFDKLRLRQPACISSKRCSKNKSLSNNTILYFRVFLILRGKLIRVSSTSHFVLWSVSEYKNYILTTAQTLSLHNREFCSNNIDFLSR